MDNVRNVEVKRRLTPKDYFRFQNLHDPQLTSHGRFASVIVEVGDMSNDRFIRQILVIDLENVHTGRIECSGGQARGVCFSPDGSKLAWVEGAENSNKIRVIDVAEFLAHELNAENVTFVVQELFEQKSLGGMLHWAPDGKSLYVDVPKVERSASGIRVYSSARYKADGAGLVDAVKTEVWRVSLDGNQHARVFTWEGTITSSALSPDGEKFAFTAAHTDDSSVFVQDLFVADVNTGETRCVFEGQGGTFAPVFAPDSASVVCTSSRDDLVTDGTLALWSVDLAAGTISEVCPGFDRPVLAMGCSDLPSTLSSSGPMFDSSGTKLRFLATDKGASGLYEVDFPTGEPRKLSPSERTAVNQFASCDTGVVIYTASDSTHPDELYVMYLDEAESAIDHMTERQLTHLNEDVLAELQLREVRPFSFAGADGWPVEGFLQLPPVEDGADGPYPLVLLIHGGPRGNFGSGFHFDAQTLAAAGIAVLYVNPRGSDTYGKEFANAVINDWGNKDYQDLMAAVDAAIERGYADPSRLGVTGYSYGGFMSTWVIGHTNRFKAAAPGGAVTNLVSFHGTSDIGWYWGPLQHNATVWEGMEHLWSMSPLAYVRNVQTPTLLYHAEGDDRCPIGQTEEFYAALKALNQDTTFVRYPKESHVGLLLGPKPSLRVDIAERVVEWFSTRL